MTKFLQKLLILLVFSVISVVAQDVAVESNCNAKLNVCFEKCNNYDEECMEACENKIPCAEETEEEYEDAEEES